MNVILGAGLAGLSAGHALHESGEDVVLIEKGSAVGGLARTVQRSGFRFDLGGHRFITKDRGIQDFVAHVLDGQFLDVDRKSQIYLLDKYFDYPLRPVNAVFGVGFNATLNIIVDYMKEKARYALKGKDVVSLEDWVVKNFGRTMFNLYFKQYSEKVWGIDCRNISQEWVSQRIKGLSLWETMKNAFFKFSGKDIHTLSDRFIYPISGIGEISERLESRIALKHDVLKNTQVLKIEHADSTIRTVSVRCGDDSYDIDGSDFISTIALTDLLRMLEPSPPGDILDAVSHLHYRDLVVVTLFLDRERITDLTWLYLPERKIPIGRIHEPRNWSPHMAPNGKTHIVAEYFCFKGDSLWNASNERLTAVTRAHLERLGFIEKKDLLGSCVVRVPRAYPLLDIGYRRHYEKVIRYLSRFHNLHIAGRGGTFQYLNMDHAMRSGMNAAGKVLGMPVREKEDRHFLARG